MKNGEFLREKRGYLQEKFSTKTGLADFFLGSAVWGFLIVQFNQPVFAYLMDLFKPLSGVAYGALQYYVAYLAFAVVWTAVGWVISYAIFSAFKEVWGE